MSVTAVILESHNNREEPVSSPYRLTATEEYGSQPGLIPFVERLHEQLVVTAKELEVPEINLSVVLTGDIVQSVRDRGEDGFTSDRGAGLVMGKTLGIARDFSETVILLHTSTNPTGEEVDLVDLLHLAVHEYGHAFIGRLRGAAGTRPPRPTRMQTLEEAALVIAYEAAEEYRCDLFSNAKLNTLHQDVDGEQVPFTLADHLTDGYRTAFANVLDAVEPGWHDLVQDYRTYRISLSDMVGRLTSETDAMFKLIAHADAVEHAAGHGPLMDQFSGHPAVAQRLGPAWTALREALDSTPIIPPLHEFAAADRAVQACGTHIAAMWASLGVRGHLTADDQLYITVS